MKLYAEELHYSSSKFYLPLNARTIHVGRNKMPTRRLKQHFSPYHCMQCLFDLSLSLNHKSVN